MGKDYRKHKKFAAQCLATILGNISAIGMGFVFYDGRGWCLVAAIIAAYGAVALAWRSGEYD